MSVKQITTGQDSFLDIVANLVGILIILVVVIGAQANHSRSKPEPKIALIEKIQDLEENVSRTSNVVAKLQTDNEQLEEGILKENRLAADLTDQRHEMLVQLEIAKRQMEKTRQLRNAEIEAVVGTRVADHEGLISKNGMSTEGYGARCFWRVEPLSRHEPLPVCVDKGEERNGSAEHALREPGDPIKARLRWRIEQGQFAQ